MRCRPRNDKTERTPHGRARSPSPPHRRHAPQTSARSAIRRARRSARPRRAPSRYSRLPRSTSSIPPRARGRSGTLPARSASPDPRPALTRARSSTRLATSGVGASPAASPGSSSSKSSSTSTTPEPYVRERFLVRAVRATAWSVGALRLSGSQSREGFQDEWDSRQAQSHGDRPGEAVDGRRAAWASKCRDEPRSS